MVRSCKGLAHESAIWAFSRGTTSRQMLASHPLPAIEHRYMAGGSEIRIDRAFHRISNQCSVAWPPQFRLIGRIRHEPHFHQHTRYVGGLQDDESGMALRI